MAPGNVDPIRAGNREAHSTPGSTCPEKPVGAIFSFIDTTVPHNDQGGNKRRPILQDTHVDRGLA